MNYKKRDDELIKLNKQVQNMKNSATNKSLSSQKSGTYGSTRKEVPYVKPNKASEMSTPGNVTTKPSTRYQNQTAGQTAPKKTRDTRYDKDFDEFHKYRLGDFSGAMDYDPVTDTSTEHWRTMKNDLMKKHGWSEEEFDTKWNNYNDERNKKASEQEVQTAVKTAKDNAILGTALQAMYTPQTWIEGGASMLSNLLPEKYKAQSADAANFTGIRTKEATKQAVKDEHIKGDGLLAKAGRGAYDVGTSLVDMALASGVPVLGAATMGAETAARTNMEALERGASANRAAATAGISGLVSGAMNKIGLDKAAGAEAKTALGKVIKGAGVEAAENMLEDSANLAVDTLINTDKSQLSALHDYYTSQGLDDKSAWNRVMLDTARDMAVSGVSGAAFGGVMNGLHNLPSLIPEVRDLTKGLKMNDVGGVDAPALLEEARAAMKAPAKVGNKLEFEPVEGEIRDKLQAEFDANTEQISKNETEIATLRELETTGSKKNQNRYKKQRKALEKENRVLEGQQPELRKMLDGYRSTFKGELSKEDANAIFDDRNGGVNNWLNLGVKFAGETDEAKALRKEAKKAIRAYVESGNIDDWHNAVKYIGDLSNLADEARIPYRTQDGKVYNYEDVFDSAETDYLGRPVQGTMFDKIYNGNTVPNIVNALHERIVPRVEGEPIDTNRIPESTGESAPIEVDPNNVVYHSGILSRLNKADSAGKMEGSRDTGYYGTGHYFVDSAHKREIGKGTNYGDKPYSSVDISKYNNLFRADTDAKASKLHSFSQKMMRYINGYNDKYYTDEEGIVPEDLKEYMDDMYSDYKSLFGNNAISQEDFETRLNDFRNNYDFNADDRGDSAFTTFMKEHGYNGVDTRGTNSANTERGVVIYDLDEDSILQSNVTDEATKNGLMNTRVRNGQPVFDSAADEKIQKSIDSYTNKQKVKQEYNRIYDETNLQQVEADIESTKERIKNLEENVIPYEEKMLEGGEEFQKEVDRTFREFKRFDPDITREDIESLLRNNELDRNNNLENSRNELNTLKQKLSELQTSYDNELKASEEAYKQARNIIERQEQPTSVQPPNRVPQLTAEEQANNNVPKLSPVEKENQKTKGDWNNPDAKFVRQSFQGKMRYISDSKNEYAKKFLDALKKFEKNPTAETYRDTVNAHNEYTANAGSKMMTNWYGLWYEKKYDPTDIDGQLKKLAKRYGIDDTDIISETPTNVPPTEPPVNNEPPTVDSMIEPPIVVGDKDLRKESRVGTHSAVNSGIFTEDQVHNDPVISELNKYIPKNEQESYDNALMNVAQNGDELLDDYINGKRTIDNDRDVDQSMILLTMLSNRLDAGDTSVTAQRNLLFGRLRQAGTKYGQTIQAFAKWNRTADGAIANSEGIIGDTVRKWKDKNVKSKEFNGRIAKALAQMGYDGSMDKEPVVKTHEQIREGVKNVIEREFGSVEGLFSDKDIDVLTNWAEEGVPTWKITDEIEHFLNHGEWYSLDESIEPKYPVNQKLKSVLDSLVDNEPAPVKEPPTLDEIRNQVRATLDQEYANRRETGDFTDEDVEYLANLINEGATKDELADALNTKMATGKFGISAETQQAVSDMFRYANKFDPDSQKAYDLRTAAYKMLANEAVSEDASAFEKFDSWRYLAMLGNPRTWVRNKVGNEMFNVVTGISNNIAAALEAGVNKGLEKMGREGIQRTKAFLNPVDDRGLIKAATEDGDNHRYSALRGEKYERGVKDAIRQQKSVFNSKALRAYEAATDWGISDYKNVKKKYGTSLAGYMKANGLDESSFDADNRYRDLLDKSRSQLLTDAEKAEMNMLKPIYDELEKARDYAVKQAEYATFHEDNAFAKWWTESSKKAPGPLGLIMEGILPFKKTPANILTSGLHLSPLGAIHSIAKTGKLIYENTGKRKGNLEDTYTGKNWKGKDVEINKTLASEVLDSWSKTATGSLLVGLGFYLKNKGIINSSNKDEKYQDQLEGKQNYSITINGHTYTLDWSAPAVMPLLMGAELSKIKDRNTMLNQKWYDNMDELVGTVNAILDPMFETSMLSGVKDTMEQVANDLKYDDKAAIGGILGSAAFNTLTGYATQGIPTLSGQIARTVDNTRRSTDTKNEGLVGVLERQGRKVMNKIPGLSYLNQPYYDSYGRTQNNGPKNPLGNLAYQMLSPGYLQKINTTPADEAARNAYYALGEPNEEGERLPIMNKDVFPSWKSKVTVNGEKYTPEQMATYRKTSGEAQYGIRDALAKEDWFNNLNGEKQTELLKKVNTFVDKVGKDANGDSPSDPTEINIYKDKGVPGLVDYWHGQDTLKNFRDETGISTSTNAYKELKALYEDGNFAEADKRAAEVKKNDADRQKYNAENGTSVKLADWEKNYSGKVTNTNKTAATTKATQTTNKVPEVKADTAKEQKYVDRAGKQSRKYTNDIPKIESLNFSSSQKYTYAYAINQDSSLTPEKFDQQYDKMDLDKNGSMKQDEMITYFNNSNVSEKEGQYLWRTYGENKGTPWKAVPVLSNGTWKKKKK